MSTTHEMPLVVLASYTMQLHVAIGGDAGAAIRHEIARRVDLPSLVRLT